MQFLFIVKQLKHIGREKKDVINMRKRCSLLSKFSSWVPKEMYGQLFGEYACYLWGLDKRTNELAMVVKDIRSLRDSFEPRLDEVWWKFAWTEIKNSSVKKYKSEQFRTWKDLDRETIFIYSINSFWIRLVVFCEFEFSQIVKFVAKSLCTIFEYS